MLFRAKDDKISLYGNIYEHDGPWVSQRLEEVDETHQVLKVHLHTNGGDVFAGNLIYNTLLGMKSEIHIYIDGLVASMGTILMLAGKKIFMAKNATLMIHAPSGLFRGKASDMRKAAELLEQLEAVFVENYMAKTKKAEADVRKWLEGDNFFSSSKAVKEGLVDEVVGSVLKNEDIQALRDMKVAAFFEARDDSFQLPEAEGSNTQNPKSKDDPMKKELIEALQLQGVSAESSDTAVIAAVQNAIAAKASQTELEKKAKEALQGKLDNLVDASVKAVLAEAKRDGRVTDATVGHYEKIGKEQGIETLNAILGEAPKRQTITGQINPTATGAAATAGKTWDEMQEKEPKVLEAMAEASHPQHEVFKSLFKAKYDTDFVA